MTHSTTSTAQLASGTQQRVVRRVRHVLRLPKCVSDETVFSVAGRSSVWAYAELYVAFEDLETEIIKALPKWVRRLLPSNPGRQDQAARKEP